MEEAAKYDVVKQMVISYLLNNYEPAKSLADATLSLTTREIYLKLQDLYPSADYSGLDVALWLEEMNFEFRDKGQLNPEWLLKKKRYGTQKIT